MEQRRTQRYQLQLPLQILQVGDARVNRTELTRDISSGGVCFASAVELELGTRVEYVITLSDSNPPVRIRCLGKVLRCMRLAQDGRFETAVTMERYQFVRAEELDAIAVGA